MRNKKITLVVSLIMILCVAITYIAYAQAGSENDPVVTLSYIKEIFKPEIENATKFKVVDLKEGQFIYGEEGTEMILRAGSAYVVSSVSGGLANVTAGYDATDETAVVKNNLYIVPRSDERGFWAASDSVLMVKGAYTID